VRFRLISKRSFPEEKRYLQTITGVSEASATTILTEIGSTVTDGHLAAS
jgi:transposase